MTTNDSIQELTFEEIEEVNGGFFWVALPLIIGAGYTWGKDRAVRDNERDKAAAG